MKFAFAGDRYIAVKVLELLINFEQYPDLMFVSNKKISSHDEELIKICKLNDNDIYYGKEFQIPSAVEKLKKLDLDYIFSIHFPYFIPKEILKIPKLGFINLHPAFLPYNKGWHTPSWSILDNTPAGATLHFMEEEVDGGDIIDQESVEVFPSDTANTLYQRILSVEFEIFKKNLPLFIEKSIKGVAQLSEGTRHLKKDIFQPKIQEINLNEKYIAGDLINKLRALTTNNLNEAAYFEKEGKKYHIQVSIKELNE